VNTILVCVLTLGAPGDSAPAIRLQETKGAVTVAVTGLPRELLEALAKWKPDAAGWGRVLAVYVDGARKGKEAPLAMLGTYRIDKDVLRFTPRFPLVKGVRYRAVFDPAALPGGSGQAVAATLSLPKPEAKPTTVVRHIYPTADKLPENQLRFYLHFSAPMSRGDAYAHVKLLDTKGKVVEWPFLELDPELWDPSGTRFTLFFHPGRVKRGLRPREEEGPVLVEGKRYTLVVDAGWRDADGNPLKEGFKKTFTVGAPDEARLDVKTWKLKAPAAGSRDPLRVTFPKPMDRALSERLVWVADGAGKKVAGKVELTERETLWSFTPERAWPAGAFHLVADTTLEDTCGNNLARPFEVDVLRPVEREIKAETIKVPFAVHEPRTK
jgi:hypothetical protein